MTNLSIRIIMLVSSAFTAVKDGMHREEGQDLLEYALLGGLIAAAIIGALLIWGTSLTNMANNIGNCIDFNSSTACKPGF